MLKILIADDHAVARRGLHSLLSEALESVQVVETGLAALALEKAQAESWDLVLLDINLPDMSGLEVLRRLRRTHPNLPVLMLSAFSEDQYIYNSLKAGASGYMSKEAAADELVTALTAILNGSRYISPMAVSRLSLDDL